VHLSSVELIQVELVGVEHASRVIVELGFTDGFRWLCPCPCFCRFTSDLLWYFTAPATDVQFPFFFLCAYIGSLKLFIPVLRPFKGQGIYLSSSSPSISFARCLGYRYICIVYFRNSSASMLCFICIRNVCRQQLIASIMPLLHGCSAFIKMYKICKLIRSRILQIYVKFLVLPGAMANEESSLGNCYTENTRRDFYDGTGGNETLFARWHPL